MGRFFSKLYPSNFHSCPNTWYYTLILLFDRNVDINHLMNNLQEDLYRFLIVIAVWVSTFCYVRSFLASIAFHEGRRSCHHKIFNGLRNFIFLLLSYYVIFDFYNNNRNFYNKQQIHNEINSMIIFNDAIVLFNLLSFKLYWSHI